MKEKIFQKKWIFYGALILFIGLPKINYAQTVKRQCISSIGTSVKKDNIYFGQTIGQFYSTTSYIENKAAVLHGFQQPSVFHIENIETGEGKNLHLNVFPNPATYVIKIFSEELIENSQISITDINGQLIFHELIAQLQTYDINCDSWNNGIYFITVTDKYNNKKSLKLIINK